MTLYKRIYQTFIHHPKDFYPEMNRRALIKDGGSALSIGAGDGALEIELAKVHRMQIGYIDPSPERYSEFSDASRRADVRYRILHAHNGTFETYESARCYDLILSIHSWYRIGFNREMLLKAIALLADGGSLLVAISSDRDVIKRELTERRPWEIAENLSNWSRAEGIPHEFFTIPVQMPIELFLSGDRITSAAKDLISFAARSSWDHLSAEIRDKALDLLRSRRPTGHVEKVHGCLLFKAMNS